MFFVFFFSKGSKSWKLYNPTFALPDEYSKDLKHSEIGNYLDFQFHKQCSKKKKKNYKQTQVHQPMILNWKVEI